MRLYRTDRPRAGVSSWLVAVLIGAMMSSAMASDARKTKIRAVIEEIEESGEASWLNISREDGELLTVLAQAIDARQVLDISEPAGYSTLWLALALDDTDGKILALVREEEDAARVRENLDKAGVSQMVTIVTGDPHNSMKHAKAPLDLVFLDADKGGNNHYLHNILPKIRAGGLLIAHDVKSEPEPVEEFMKTLKVIPKVNNVVLDAAGKGMSISVVRHRSTTGETGMTAAERAAYHPPGPQMRKVSSKPEHAILGYINHVPPETPEEKAKRLKIVAQRRKGMAILVHRGDDGAAPENTLEAYMAAMDNGADGIEIDIRQSKDGVLYFMHDSKLDRTTHGTGKGKHKTYYEILQAGIRKHGRADKHTRVPTMCSFLELARRQGMLLHLDVKESGLEDELIALFDAFDMWDHLAEVNGGNAIPIRHHLRVDLMGYKGGWGGTDGKEDRIRRLLDSPGQLIFTETPSSAAKYLGRETGRQTPLPEDLRVWWTPEGPVQIVPEK